MPDPQTPFEIAMGATVLPTLAEVDPATFLPSSRSVAFTKTAWAAAGGYPEWLDYCEDLIFDFRLREVAGPFGWAPDAVAHFRPRGSLAAFFKQYYRYARGDGKADLWRKRHAIRYATYLVALPGLLALAVVHSPVVAAGAARRRGRLLPDAVSPAVAAPGRAVAPRPPGGAPARARHPRRRRCGEDAGLSGRLALAAAELVAGGDPLAAAATHKAELTFLCLPLISSFPRSALE